jgi:hypothetical protein
MVFVVYNGGLLICRYVPPGLRNRDNASASLEQGPKHEAPSSRGPPPPTECQGSRGGSGEPQSVRSGGEGGPSVPARGGAHTPEIRKDLDRNAQAGSNALPQAAPLPQRDIKDRRQGARQQQQPQGPSPQQQPHPPQSGMSQGPGKQDLRGSGDRRWERAAVMQPQGPPPTATNQPPPHMPVREGMDRSHGKSPCWIQRICTHLFSCYCRKYKVVFGFR